MPYPTPKDLESLHWLLEKLQNAEDYCRPYFDRAKRHYELYRFGSAVKGDDWPYVNRVRSRDILAFIEDSTALLVQTLFATMPFFSIIPRQTSAMRVQFERIDPLKIGRQLERALDYQIVHEDTEFFEEMIDCFKGGTMLGNSYMGVYPKFTNGKYLRPLLKTTDYWDILPVSGARRVSKARGIFVREFVTLEDLKLDAEQAGYTNIDKIKAPVSSSTDPERDWHKVLLQEVGMTNWVADDNEIETIHYFSGGHVITFADRKVILRDSNGAEKPYPYNMPIVQYKYMPVPLEFFAMGIPEVLEVLQEDKNLVRSARRDNIDLVINTIIKARQAADINFDLIKFYPGAIWPLENLTDVEELEQKDVTQSSYHEEGLIQKDMENALSLFGYARGMTPEHSEQPTTVMKLQQASLNRLDLAIKLAEFTTLQNIATRVILLTRKYMDQGDYENIIGERDAGFYRISEEEIRRFYYVKPVGSSVTNIKEIRQAQIQFAIDSLSKIPPQMMADNVEPFRVNWYEALRTALENADIKNLDRILVKIEQQQQRMGPFANMTSMMPMAEEMAALGGVGYGGY